MEAKPNRFDRMAVMHPKEYNACMNKYGMKEVLELIEMGCKPLSANIQLNMPFT